VLAGEVSEALTIIGIGRGGQSAVGAVRQCQQAGAGTSIVDLLERLIRASPAQG